MDSNGISTGKPLIFIGFLRNSRGFHWKPASEDSLSEIYYGEQEVFVESFWIRLYGWGRLNSVQLVKKVIGSCLAASGFLFSTRGRCRVRSDGSRRHRSSMAVPFARRIPNPNQRKRAIKLTILKSLKRQRKMWSRWKCFSRQTRKDTRLSQKSVQNW